MLEGIPLDMVEDDVGHHLPIFASLDASLSMFNWSKCCVIRSLGLG